MKQAKPIFRVVNEVTCSFEKSCDGWREAIKNLQGPVKLLFRNEMADKDFHDLKPPKGLTGKGFVMAFSDSPVHVVLASPSFPITKNPINIKTDIFMSKKFDFKIDLSGKMTTKKGKEVDIPILVYSSILEDNFQPDEWFRIDHFPDVTRYNFHSAKLVFKANVTNTKNILAIKNLLVEATHPDDLKTTTKIFPSLETVPSTLSQDLATMKDVNIPFEYTTEKKGQTMPYVTTEDLDQKSTRTSNDFVHGTSTTTIDFKGTLSDKNQEKTTLFKSTIKIDDRPASTTDDINKGVFTDQNYEHTTNTNHPNSKTSTSSPDDINKSTKTEEGHAQTTRNTNHKLSTTNLTNQGTLTNNYHDQTTIINSETTTTSPKDINQGTTANQDHGETSTELSTSKDMDSKTNSIAKDTKLGTSPNQVQDQTTIFIPTTSKDSKVTVSTLNHQGRTTIFVTPKDYDSKVVPSTHRTSKDTEQTSTTSRGTKKRNGNYQYLDGNKKPFFKNEDGAFKGVFYPALVCFFGIILTVTIIGAAKTLKQQRVRREREENEKRNYYRLPSRDSEGGVPNVVFVV